MVKRFRVSISDESYDALMLYCDKAGATRSKVIDVLIDDYLDNLIEDVADLVKEKTEDEDALEDESESANEKSGEKVIFPDTKKKTIVYGIPPKNEDVLSKRTWTKDE